MVKVVKLWKGLLPEDCLKDRHETASSRIEEFFFYLQKTSNISAKKSFYLLLLYESEKINIQFFWGGK